MHIIFVTLLCVSSTMFCSAPTGHSSFKEEFVELARTKPIGEICCQLPQLRNKYNMPPTPSGATQEISAIDSAIFFVSLVPDIQVKILHQHFFDGGADQVADAFVKTLRVVPYAKALNLLLVQGQQQKPRPYIHLKPIWILLLSHEQVAVVNEIEKQYIEAQQNPPAAPAAAPVMIPLFFENQQAPYAKLNNRQLKILKSIPSKALKDSPLRGKTIAYKDSLIGFPYNALKDVMKSFIVDATNQESLLITGAIMKTISVFKELAICNKPSDALQKGILLCGSCLTDAGIWGGLKYNIIRCSANYKIPARIGIRAAIDIIGFRTSISESDLLIFTSCPYLIPGAIFIFCYVLASRLKISHANGYTVTGKNKTTKSAWCTLV